MNNSYRFKPSEYAEEFGQVFADHDHVSKCIFLWSFILAVSKQSCDDKFGSQHSCETIWQHNLCNVRVKDILTSIEHRSRYESARATEIDCMLMLICFSSNAITDRLCAIYIHDRCAVVLRIIRSIFQPGGVNEWHMTLPGPPAAICQRTRTSVSLLNR